MQLRNFVKWETVGYISNSFLFMQLLINNNVFSFSSFTISEANYRFTLGYHGIAFFIYKYIFSTLLNHFFLTIPKYFPTFYICVLFVIFIIFLHVTSLFMFSHLSFI
jgi:hypothetical protein